MMMTILEVLEFDLQPLPLSPSKSYRQSRLLLEISTADPLKFGIDLQPDEGSMLPYLLFLVLAPV